MALWDMKSYARAPSNRITVVWVQIAQALEGVRDALTPRPGGEGALGCCGRLHNRSQLLDHRACHQTKTSPNTNASHKHHRVFARAVILSAPHHVDDPWGHLGSGQILAQLEEPLH